MDMHQNNELSTTEILDVQGVLDALHSDTFIQRHTKFESCQDFFECLGFAFEQPEDVDLVDAELFDSYLREYSDLFSWQEMVYLARLEKTALLQRVG